MQGTPPSPAVQGLIQAIPQDILERYTGDNGGGWSLIERLTDPATEQKTFHELFALFTFSGSLDPNHHAVYLKMMIYGVARGIMAPTAVQTAQKLLEAINHQVSITATRADATMDENQAFLRAATAPTPIAQRPTPRQLSAETASSPERLIAEESEPTVLEAEYTEPPKPSTLEEWDGRALGSMPSFYGTTDDG